MEDRIQQRINDKLKLLGIKFEDIKPFMKERLEQVETVIDEKNQNYVNGMKLINDINFNTKMISEMVGCSRTTLYNHEQLLKRYIDLSVKLSEDMKKPVNADCYTEEIEILKEQVHKMEIRDVNEAINKVEIKRMQDKITALEKDKELLYVRLNNVTKELNELKSKEMTASKTSDIINNVVSITKQ